MTKNNSDSTPAKKAAKKKTAKDVSTETNSPPAGFASEGGLFVPDSGEFRRDKRGLLKGVEYKFNEDGTVDWRAMIPEEFLYPNRGWFESQNKPVPSSAEGLDDHQLLVKLGGIKHIARLRGYRSVDYEFAPHSTPEHVAVKCTILFIENFETNSTQYSCGDVQFSSLANATIANLSDFVAKFPETIAENRAFVRCVRNFLGINIVGDDEIDKNKAYIVGQEDSPTNKTNVASSILEKIISKNANINNFEEFKSLLRSLFKTGEYNPIVPARDIGNWNDFMDIPAPEVRNIIGVINKHFDK